MSGHNLTFRVLNPDTDEYETREVWQEDPDNEDEEKLIAIDDLKVNLGKSDYRITKVMEKFLLTIPEFADLIREDANQRQTWRDEINRLEEEMNGNP